MKIAIEGCAHGELEKIYESIAYIEEKEGYKVDMLICCGDFQATRNLSDLECMAIPRKFFDMCSFYKYYSGEKTAPMLTIFIGGNHEASNYLQELPYGGWVAPNIYYLGYAGVINVNGIRIGGISGIYKGNDFLRGRYEFAPYTQASMRSVYHIRQLDVFRLRQLTAEIDIFLSHDWPRGVYHHGDAAQLIRFKPFFKDEIEKNQLGSPPCEELLNVLQPSYWFAAHLHCKFSALVHHESAGKATKFLALDKCLPKRQFLQILDIGSDLTTDRTAIEIEYDLEWLTILNLTNHLISVKTLPNYLPDKRSEERSNFTPTSAEKDLVLNKFENNLKVPRNFVRTADAYNPNSNENKHFQTQPKSTINPQTTLLVDKLQIDDPLSLAMLLAGEELNHSIPSDDQSVVQIDDEIDVDYDDSDTSARLDTSASTIVEESPSKIAPLASTLPKPKWLNQESPTVRDEPNANEESVLENCDNKWIEDRSGSEKSTAYSLTDIERTPDNTVIGNETIIALADDHDSSMTDVNSVLLNTTDPPVKKFKRRNHTLYSSNLADEQA